MSNETEKICTGCGRSSLNPIQEQYAACCPDNNYVIMSKNKQQTDHIVDTNKMVTAVDWFAEQIRNYKTPLNMAGVEFILIHKEMINKFEQQAKEMEKEQIIDAFVECWKENMPDGYECKQSAEYYYNETYGGNK